MTDNLESLFDSAESLSPRLAWMRKHGIMIDSDYRDDWDGEERPFIAYVPYKVQAFGDTEDEALSALASKLNIKMWNE